MIAALLLAAATTLPPLPQMNGTPALASSGATQFTFYVAGDNRPDKGNDPSPAFERPATVVPAARGSGPSVSSCR